MYVFQSSSGWELDMMTSNMNNEKLRSAIKSVTGEVYPNATYATRAAAEAVMGRIHDTWRSI